MRCDYCNQLIIHRFDGKYKRTDKRRKQRHMKMCECNPDNIDEKLNFDYKFKDELVKRNKYKTIRKVTDLNVGDTVNSFLVKEKTEEFLGVLRIKSIKKIKIKDIELGDLLGHNTNSKEELKKNLENYYDFDRDTVFNIIEFEIVFLPQEREMGTEKTSKFFKY